MEKFSLVTPTIEYQSDAIEYINEFKKYNSAINGVGGLHRYLDDYSGWLKKLEEDKNRIPSEEKVPALTFFLVRENDNHIVGMINIRLALNSKLKEYGGHIGYSIRPTERRKGYNKINLYLGLLVCQEHGIKEAFLDCDKDNLGSAKTMRALGGIMVREYFDEKNSHCLVQDYLFDVDKCIENNKDIYSQYVNDCKIK